MSKCDTNKPEEKPDVMSRCDIDMIMDQIMADVIHLPEYSSEV